MSRPSTHDPSCIVRGCRQRFDQTEWFALSERLLSHIDVVRAGDEDPWDRYLRWVTEAVALRG